MNKTMTVKIFTIENGLEVKENVKIIRIKSSNYNLLIMEDYIPIIGEVDGSINIESIDESINYDNIKGYYMNSNNVFNLIIKGE